MHGTAAFEDACYKHLTNKVKIENMLKDTELKLKEQTGKLRSMQSTIRIRKKEIIKEKAVRSEVKTSANYKGSDDRNKSPLLSDVITATLGEHSKVSALGARVCDNNNNNTSHGAVAPLADRTVSGPACKRKLDINPSHSNDLLSSSSDLDAATSRIAELEAALALERAKQVIARDLVRVRSGPSNNVQAPTPPCTPDMYRNLLADPPVISLYSDSSSSPDSLCPAGSTPALKISSAGSSPLISLSRDLAIFELFSLGQRDPKSGKLHSTLSLIHI